MTYAEEQAPPDFLVVGAGLAGLTVALRLAMLGKRVVVLEGCADIAQGASNSNGGMLTPSMAEPWNTPGVYKQLFASFFDPDSAMKLRVKAIPSLWRWGPKFLLNSSQSQFAGSSRANFLLANYSVSQMQVLQSEIGFSYDRSTLGTMKVFRDVRTMNLSVEMAGELKAHGLRFSVVGPDEISAIEPAMATASRAMVGGIHFENDETGDAEKFCRLLAARLSGLGSEVRTNQTVERIVIKNQKVAGVQAGGEFVEAKNVIVAGGVDSPKLISTAGIRVHVKPAKGYSLTFECAGLENLPRISIIDEVMHAAVVPIGSRLRAVGTAELAGFDRSLTKSRIDNLFRLLRLLYPEISEQFSLEQGAAWAGLRPMSADGLPYIGGTKVKGLYVNTGHGHLGWTMAAGSAALLCDLALGRQPQIDPSPYRVHR